MVLNKVDVIDEVAVDKLRGRWPDAAFISAAGGAGVEELVERLGEELTRLRVEVRLMIPFDHGELVARVHREGEVLEESYSEEGTLLVARLQREALEDLGPYLAEVS
jgi:GTP-binding protein HflX